MGPMIGTVSTQPVLEFADKQIRVRVESGKVTDWRLGKTPAECLRLCESVFRIMSEMGVSELYAPYPEGGSRIAKASEFSVSLLGHRTVYRGAHGDGVLITAGQGAQFATGDCPTLILSDRTGQQAIVAHCSRDGILQGMNGGRSVVENAVDTLKEVSPVPVGDWQGWIIAGIRGEHFRHTLADSKYGERNRRLLDYVRQHYTAQCTVGSESDGIDCRMIIIQQLERSGVSCHRNVKGDGVDTYSDPSLASHRAGDSNRNGVFVGLSA